MPYEVKLSVAIHGNGEDAPFRSGYDMNYHELSYAALQALQHKLSDSLLEMGDAKLKASKK